MPYIGLLGSQQPSRARSSTYCLKVIMCTASNTGTVDIRPSLLVETADGLSLCSDWADGHQKFTAKALHSLWSKLLGRTHLKPRPFLLL